MIRSPVEKFSGAPGVGLSWYQSRSSSVKRMPASRWKSAL
jgi:hypothetical protein